MNVLECNAFLALENSQHLVTIISHNCNARRNCGLWWAFADAGHCLQVRQQAPDETSLNRGRVAHISSRLLNSKAYGSAGSARDDIQGG